MKTELLTVRSPLEAYTMYDFLEQNNEVIISYDQQKTVLFNFFYFFRLIFLKENPDMGHNPFNVDVVAERVQDNIC